MESVSIRDLFQNTARYAGKTICVGGWVRSVRASKAFGFIVLHDGTFFTPLQVVYHDNLDNLQEISKTNVEAALVVTVSRPGGQPLSSRKFPKPTGIPVVLRIPCIDIFHKKFIFLL